MEHLTLSDVEWINLNMLATIHAGLQGDPAAACSRYALDAAQAERLRHMPLDELWSLVLHVGDTTLFPPRADLLTLLAVPHALAGPLALVHHARPLPLRQLG